MPANMSKNAAILFARSKQDFRTVEKTDVDGMLNIYEGHLRDTGKNIAKGTADLRVDFISQDHS